MVTSGGENSATGSAAEPAVAWRVLRSLVEPGQSVVIEQGVEVHRTSPTFARAGFRDGHVENVRVGGHCVPLTEGELAL